MNEAQERYLIEVREKAQRVYDGEVGPLVEWRNRALARVWRRYNRKAKHAQARLTATMREAYDKVRPLPEPKQPRRAQGK